MSRRKSGTRAARPLEVQWTDRALTDLRAIGDYIAKDSPAAEVLTVFEGHRLFPRNIAPEDD